MKLRNTLVISLCCGLAAPLCATGDAPQPTLRYMFLRAEVGGNIVRYCDRVAPELKTSIGDAYSHYQAALLDAERLLSKRGVKSAYLDQVSPDAQRVEAARIVAQTEASNPDPRAFCETFRDRMRASTPEQLAKLRVKSLRRADDDLLRDKASSTDAGEDPK